MVLDCTAGRLEVDLITGTRYAAVGTDSGSNCFAGMVELRIAGMRIVGRIGTAGLMEARTVGTVWASN